MAIRILINESNASRRAVPIWLVGSNGTTPATGESGNTFMFSIGGVFYGSGGSLSATSAVNGMYDCVFSASKVSVLGPGQVMYGSATALPMSTPFEIVPVDSYDSMRMGLFALPNAAAEAAGGLLTIGTGTGQLSVSAGSVGLKAQNHSGASVEIKTGGIQVASVGLGSYSGISVEVATGGIQTSSVGAGTYSGMSVEVKTGGIQAASLGAGTITSAKFGASAIDAAALATDAGQEIADQVLGRNIAGGSSTGRIVSEALYPLRNRVWISGSTGTVFQVDDAISSWTFTVVSLGTLPLAEINPTGP